MANTYNGQIDTAKSPAPAPAPGALPAISIPAGTDVRTIESITQQMQVTTDYQTLVQKSVLLDVPTQNASGTGFTSPVYTNFGGTVAPSGSIHISDGTRFMIQIQTGGAVGTATFKSSKDGGNTYGVLQTTAASMTDATTSITLAFSGTFTAGGIATFRSAFTPQAAWQDANQRTRSIIDFLGKRTSGRNDEFREAWMVPQSSITSGATCANPIWQFSASGANSSLVSGDPTVSPVAVGNFMSMVPGTANTNAAALYQRKPFWTSNFATVLNVLECEFVPVTSMANITWTFGWTSDPTSSILIAPPTNSGAWFTSAAGGNWNAVTQSGTGTQTAVSTGVAPTVGTIQRFRIVTAGSNTQYGAYTILFFVNDNPPTAITTTMPPTGAGAYYLFFAGVCTGTATGSGKIYPVYQEQNRFSSSPAF